MQTFFIENYFRRNSLFNFIFYIKNMPMNILLIANFYTLFCNVFVMQDCLNFVLNTWDQSKVLFRCDRSLVKEPSSNYKIIEIHTTIITYS